MKILSISLSFGENVTRILLFFYPNLKQDGAHQTSNFVRDCYSPLETGSLRTGFEW
jgi:hypothetical protein